MPISTKKELHDGCSKEWASVLLQISHTYNVTIYLARKFTPFKLFSMGWVTFNRFQIKYEYEIGQISADIFQKFTNVNSFTI